MKKAVLLIFILISSLLSSQSTFSKWIDMSETAIRNHTRDMIIVEDEIIALSLQFCDEDTIYIECGVYSRFNFEGELLQLDVNDTIATFNGGYNSLCYANDAIYHSVNIFGDSYSNTFIYKYDTEFNAEEIYVYPGAESQSDTANEGIYEHQGSLYIYGNVVRSGVPDTAQIIKTDYMGNEMWRRYYSFGDSKMRINSLQSTPDGNLAFILARESPPGPSNGKFNGFQLMEIDTSGELVKTIAYHDYNRHSNRLLVNSDGGYVFGSKKHPFDGFDPWTAGAGLINKMDSDLDTLLWSLPLPNDPLMNGRLFRIQDFAEASNGDILACGQAYDTSDSEPGVPDINWGRNGFIIRVSPEGEIVWLKIYKCPNNLLPHDEYGMFREAILFDIEELPDGRIVALGDRYIGSEIYGALYDTDTELFDLWLLMVDADGCIEGYDCDDVIRLKPGVDIKASYGDKWIYEIKHSLGSGHFTVGSSTFTVQDTIFDGTRTIQMMGNDRFYVEDKKMYFWDGYYEEYVMHFDWESTTSYEVKYYNQFTQLEAVATVVIDSISYLYFDNDSLLVQHARVINGGSFESPDPYIIYEGIGATKVQPKLWLGCGLCDFEYSRPKLRCFVDMPSERTYHFVDYACDSTWSISSVNNIMSEEIKTSPNPAGDYIMLEHSEGFAAGTTWQLMDINGRVLRTELLGVGGHHEQLDLGGLSSGLYIQVVRVAGQLIWRSKVVKVE